MSIELTEQEREALGNLIQRRLHGLGPEIHRTEAREFRRHLEGEQVTLEGILSRLKAAPAMTA